MRPPHKIRSARLFRRTPKIQSTIHMASAGRRWLPLQVKLRHYVMAHWHQRLGEANGSIRGRVKTAGRWQLAFTRSNEGGSRGADQSLLLHKHACLHASCKVFRSSWLFLLLYLQWLAHSEAQTFKFSLAVSDVNKGRVNEWIYPSPLEKKVLHFKLHLKHKLHFTSTVLLLKKYIFVTKISTLEIKSVNY